MEKQHLLSKSRKEKDTWKDSTKEGRKSRRKEATKGRRIHTEYRTRKTLGGIGSVKICVYFLPEMLKWLTLPTFVY